MKIERACAGVALLATLSAAAAANATTVEISFDQSGVPVATGSFSYTTGETGILTYSDLTSFTINLGADSYTLADLSLLPDFQYFGYNTATNSFVTSVIDSFQITIGAINGSFTDGFFCGVPSPGAACTDYSGGANYDFDSIVLTVEGAATPEPATWAMMLLGAGAAGGALRLARRRKNPSATT